MLKKVLRRKKKLSVFDPYREDWAKRTDIYVEGWLDTHTGKLVDNPPPQYTKKTSKPKKALNLNLDEELGL